MKGVVSATYDGPMIIPPPCPVRVNGVTSCPHHHIAWVGNSCPECDKRIARDWVATRPSPQRCEIHNVTLRREECDMCQTGGVLKRPHPNDPENWAFITPFPYHSAPDGQSATDNMVPGERAKRRWFRR